MKENTKTSQFILGVFIFLGLAALGYLLGDAAIKVKEYERTVVVKGLSSREFKADTVVWPIQFKVANNDLEALYHSVESISGKIKQFLIEKGISAQGISFTAPTITDKSADEYGGSRAKPEFRYTAQQVVTVYSKKVDKVRSVISSLAELGKQGIVFTSGEYQYMTEYLFTRLNQVKPEMVEEATKKAREVAEKFAADSHSRLGKIKRASQGQFSISPRDSNNPHIKKVRVVSTVEYYLSD
jgi:hypothetical protein